MTTAATARQPSAPRSTAHVAVRGVAAFTISLSVACSSHTAARPAAATAQATPTGTAAATPAAVTVTQPLTPANTTALQTALTSAVPTQVLHVLAPSVRTRYVAKPFPLLPTGSQLRVDAGALTQTGTTATVPATVTGPEPGRWLLLLVRDGQAWALYGTRKLPA